MKDYDIICLSETKTDVPNLQLSQLHDYKCHVMQKKEQKFKYGGVHGLCILVKSNIFPLTTKIDDTSSDSVLWIKIDKSVTGFEFILAAVYIPGKVQYIIAVKYLIA